MSHFTVAVITKEGQDVDELLAPFCESDEEYMNFIDITDELRSDYETGTVRRIVMPDGTNYDPHDLRFKTEISAEERDKFKENGIIEAYEQDKKWHCYTYVYPEDAKIVNIPIKDAYDFDTYAKEYAGYSCEDGRYGYRSNPNAKWDWYEMGGRWAGMLKAKSGEHGTPSWCKKGYQETDGYFDSAKIKDIDFTPDKAAYEKAIRFWEVVVDGEPLADGENEADFCTYYKKEYYTDRYGSKEQFAKERSEFSTFAVVTPDGEWHEQGRMGWWGCSSETEEEAREWANSWYDAFIKGRDGEEILTVIDCHI